MTDARLVSALHELTKLEPEPSANFLLSWEFFYGSGYLSEWRPTGACLERVVGSNEPAKFEPYGARRTRLREYPIWQPCCSVEQTKPVSFPPLSLQKKMPDTISGKLRLYDFY